MNELASRLQFGSKIVNIRCRLDFKHRFAVKLRQLIPQSVGVVRLCADDEGMRASDVPLRDVFNWSHSRSFEIRCRSRKLEQIQIFLAIVLCADKRLILLVYASDFVMRE